MAEDTWWCSSAPIGAERLQDDANWKLAELTKTNRRTTNNNNNNRVSKDPFVLTPVAPPIVAIRRYRQRSTAQERLNQRSGGGGGGIAVLMDSSCLDDQNRKLTRAAQASTSSANGKGNIAQASLRNQHCFGLLDDLMGALDGTIELPLSSVDRPSSERKISRNNPFAWNCEAVTRTARDARQAKVNHIAPLRNSHEWTFPVESECSVAQIANRTDSNTNEQTTVLSSSPTPRCANGFHQTGTSIARNCCCITLPRCMLHRRSMSSPAILSSPGISASKNVVNKKHVYSCCQVL